MSGEEAPKCSRFARCSGFPENISNEPEDGIVCSLRMFRKVSKLRRVKLSFEAS